MRTEFFQRLSYAVKGGGHNQSTAIDQPLADAEHLLTSALKSDMSKRDAEAIQENSELIMSFLNDPSSERFFEKFAADWTPHRLAQLYEALGSDESCTRTMRPYWIPFSMRQSKMRGISVRRLPGP